MTYKLTIKTLWGCALFFTSVLPLPGQSPCERFPAGSNVVAPQDLYSENGVLSVDLTYQSGADAGGKPNFCFITSDGAQSPTLHVHPGDVVKLNVTNLVGTGSEDKAGQKMQMEMDMGRLSSEDVCGAMVMNGSSVNLHYHGTNLPPVCGQDEVIRTIINTGETFSYELHFPKDEPPGLYWYHPHIHGLSEGVVQGGASGALIVEGIENVNSDVAGLPQQLLIIRDRTLTGAVGDDVPAYDLSVNYIPVAYPGYKPAQLSVPPGEKQFWRVLNAAADSILDLQLLYDGQAQPLGLVALDGVPIGSQDGTRKGKTLTANHVLIPPAGRAEFIVTGPPETTRKAQLVTKEVNTGPDGANTPLRPLVAINASLDRSRAIARKTVPAASGPPPIERFEGLDKAKPTDERVLYFSEDSKFFYVTVDGAKPRPFRMDNPPAITTTQGAVEDWTIENRSGENHEFHIHQIHFRLMERNGVAVSRNEQQYLDTVDIPFWSGTGPYPSVKVRMDFRGPTVGDFVYHCHILQHEDQGMMAIIRVLPPASRSQH